MRLNPVLDALGAYPIATVHERARALADAGRRVIDFSIGDPREPTPPFIPAALRDAVPEVSQYPLTVGRGDLRRAVADYFGRRFGVEVDPERHVIATSGAKEAVFNTPLAFIDRTSSDVVVFGTPGYPVYERGALFAGAAIHPVVLSGDFVLRASDVPDDVWPSVKLVWTCTPHNPTGSVSTERDLAELLDHARSVGALLLSDECYSDVYEPEVYPDGPPSALEVAGPDVAGVLSFVSCSKRSGMTGYRSGAIVGDADAIAALRRLRTTTGTVPAEFVQEAAAAAWADDAHAEERRAVFASKRAVLREAFTKFGYETVASQAGLYLWVDVGDDVAMTDRLLEAGVVVSPGRFFGPGGEGYIRLALVPTLEECRAAVEVLRQCLT